MAASGVGARLRLSSRCLTSFFQSGMFGSGYAIDRGHERFPCVALCGEHLPACRSQLVITSPPLSGLLHPAALDPAAFLEPVEQRVERCNVKTQGAFRARLDKFADLVAVPGPDLDQRQDQQLGAALLQLAVDRW